jgi:hypothetical protein
MKKKPLLRTGPASLPAGAQNPPRRVGARKTTRKASPAAKGTGAAAQRGSGPTARRQGGSLLPRGPGSAAPRRDEGATRRGLGAAVLALSIGAAWLTGLPGIADRPARVWRGYDTLLVRSDVAESGGMQKVVNALGPGVVSDGTATVSFWDFTGVQGVAVSLIDTRIDPSDPRHDRVMDMLPRYFHTSSGQGGRWSIAYIPSRRAAALDYLKVVAVLGFPIRGDWRMAEFDAVELLVAIAGLLALAALLAFPFGKEGRTRLLIAGAGALLWVPFLFPGGVARIALALLLHASWFQVVEVFIDLRGSNEKLLRAARDPMIRFIAAAGVGLVLFPTSGFSAAALAGFAGPAAASVLLLIALALFWGRAPRRPRRRKKFDPVPIVKSVSAAARPGQAGFLLVFLVVLAVAAINLSRNAPVPTPVTVSGVHDYSWESLARLSGQKKAARLPDMSDLVTHEAFQQTIAFGRSWKLPGRDERVYMREFSMNGRAGPIVEGFRMVKVFDSSWLESVTRRFAPGSIEGMLISQGGPVAVAFRRQVGALLRDVPLAVLVLFVFSAWFVRDRRTAPLMKNVLVRLNGTARRNQVQ